ncbi:MAG: hypothetical protein ABSC06_27320 [Rhodopila sp.]|jgi:hypothetical protein
MSKPTRGKPSRRTCPLCAEPPHHGGLPTAIPFGIPTYWSPDAALTIFEFINEMRDIVLAVYRTDIQDAARQRCQFTPAEPVAIPDDELPF